MGGLAGGLYGVFDALGELFLTILIGSKRAQRAQLVNVRVCWGGFLTFSFIFVGLFLIEQDNWFGGRLVLALFCGLLVGSVTGLGLAAILISYLESLEWEPERERQRAEKEREEEEGRAVEKQRYKEKYDELIGLGWAPDQARSSAELHSKYGRGGTSGCFIATAVFGSNEAAEVLVLREWKDKFLLSFFIGRVLVRAYYLISPHFVQPIEQSGMTKRLLRAVLERTVEHLRNEHSSRQASPSQASRVTGLNK